MVKPEVKDGIPTGRPEWGGRNGTAGMGRPEWDGRNGTAGGRGSPEEHLTKKKTVVLSVMRGPYSPKWSKNHDLFRKCVSKKMYQKFVFPDVSGIFPGSFWAG